MSCMILLTYDTILTLLNRQCLRDAQFDIWYRNMILGQLYLTTTFFFLQCIQLRTQGVVLKYCNFEGYAECILLMYPKGDVIFLYGDVIIVIGHHTVMRQFLHCKSGQ